jgi:hypothetical protein
MFIEQPEMFKASGAQYAAETKFIGDKGTVMSQLTPTELKGYLTLSPAKQEAFIKDRIAALTPKKGGRSTRRNKRGSKKTRRHK